LRALVIEKIEAQKADVDGVPFSIVEGSSKAAATDLTLPMKKCPTADRDLLLGPQMSGREMIPRHSNLAPPFQTSLDERRVDRLLVGRLANSRPKRYRVAWDLSNKKRLVELLVKYFPISSKAERCGFRVAES